MPPAGAARPDKVTYDALATFLHQIVPYQTLVLWTEKDGHLIVERILGKELAGLAAARIAALKCQSTRSVSCVRVSSCSRKVSYMKRAD